MLLRLVLLTLSFCGAIVCVEENWFLGCKNETIFGIFRFSIHLGGKNVDVLYMGYNCKAEKNVYIIYHI